MQTLAIYDYVPSRGLWKVIRLEGETTLRAKDIPYAPQISSLESSLDKLEPGTDWTLSRYDRCADEQHSLETATFKYYSQNGQAVFAVCACKRLRQISIAAWDAAHKENTP